MIIKNYKDYIEALNEGLIKTLDGERGLNYLINVLSLLDYNVSGEFINDKVIFTLNEYNHTQNNRIDDLFDTISSIMTNVYGWFPSVMIITNDQDFILKRGYDEKYLKAFKDSIKSFTIEFDSKFDNIETMKFDKLYHLSIIEYDKKIRKYGLIPRSKSKLSSHIDRVYVCSNIKDCEVLIPQMKLHYAMERDNNLYKLGNKKYKKDARWIIYEIDNTADKTLYNDPCYENGYYILDNISPSDITEISRES